ncbi:MAG: response regulator transcription factor [Deltaproteobacteria bacterium]|nr:MAG: response regulator transcription factor [Deltaproteobacteria bacterium]
MTVLLVDTEPAVRERLAEVLHRAGHRVVGQATSLRDGVLLAVDRRPAVVVADLLAADDGLSWLRVMRELLPETEVLVRAERVPLSDALACLRGGASRVVDAEGLGRAFAV